MTDETENEKKRLTTLEAMTLRALEVGQTEDEPWEVLADAIEEIQLKGLARKIRAFSEPQPPYGKARPAVHQNYYFTYRSSFQLQYRKDEVERFAVWLGLEDIHWTYPNPVGEVMEKSNLPPIGHMSLGVSMWVRSMKSFFIYVGTKEGNHVWAMQRHPQPNRPAVQGSPPGVSLDGASDEHLVRETYGKGIVG